MLFESVSARWRLPSRIEDLHWIDGECENRIARSSVTGIQVDQIQLIPTALEARSAVSSALRHPASCYYCSTLLSAVDLTPLAEKMKAKLRMLKFSREEGVANADS